MTTGTTHDGGHVVGPQRFRKRPVEVEALRYVGPAWLLARGGRVPYGADEWAELRRFTQGKLVAAHVGTVTHGGSNQYAPAIRTLEGVMRISPGDWVIKGVAGEFYPCKPDIFEATYEPVDAARGDQP